MKDTNPIPGPQPETVDEMPWTHEQADALQDAYMMLLDLGFDDESTWGIRTVLNQTTIYNDRDTQAIFEA